MIKRIVVIGPESTGKSTLCKQLAEHYDTAWCPEFARGYLSEKGMDYTYEDLTMIAKGQLESEASLETKAKNGLYFIDTDMYVMKVWYEVAFANCPVWVLKKIAQVRHDLYLLCNTDLPWEKDNLREYPDFHMRQKLFKMYKDIAVNSCTPWVEISGLDEHRLHLAIESIDTIFKKN